MCGCGQMCQCRATVDLRSCSGYTGVGPSCGLGGWIRYMQIDCDREWQTDVRHKVRLYK